MKKVKNTLLILSIALSIVIIQSCDSGEDLSTEAAQVNLEMKAVTNQSQIANGRVEASGYVFTEFVIGVTEIELETLEENEEEANGGESEGEEVEYEGEFVVDLLAGTSTPDFGLSSLEANVYEEVEIEFENILEGGHTLIAKFKFLPEGATDSTFVEFTTDEELELEIENDNGFVIDGGLINNVLVILDLDVLFADVDFNSLTRDEEGVVRINEDVNSDVMDLVVEKLEVALEAEEDEFDEEED